MKNLYTCYFSIDGQNGFYRVKAHTLDDAITKTKLMFGVRCKFHGVKCIKL